MIVFDEVQTLPLKVVLPTLATLSHMAARYGSSVVFEAGVDLDFPAVFRAMGPLDAIAQAAGRCNRNGRVEAGALRVFVPEDAGYPPGVYKQAADVAAVLLNRPGGSPLTILDRLPQRPVFRFRN